MIPLDETARTLIERALEEDVGAGDWTTLWTVGEKARAEAVIVAKAEGVLAGARIVAAVFERVDPALKVEFEAADGERLAPGARVCTLRGPARAILTGERTALNFLQRLSGIASLTRRFVDRIEGTGAIILDTRKTTPGWRSLEKAAVRVGGGSNHRTGLFDMVLIKENHIAAAGGIAEAVERVREHNSAGLAVEVEVTSLEELDIAIRAGVDRILLDNMSLEMMREAVELTRRFEPDRPELEASGNMSLERVRAVAETGVDFISVGALTHSAPALDLSLRFLEE